MNHDHTDGLECPACAEAGVDKKKTLAVANAVIEAFNQNQMTVAESTIALNMLIASVLGAVEPSERWQVRTEFIAMMLRCAVKQDANVDVHMMHETPQ